MKMLLQNKRLGMTFGGILIVMGLFQNCGGVKAENAEEQAPAEEVYYLLNGLPVQLSSKGAQEVSMIVDVNSQNRIAAFFLNAPRGIGSSSRLGVFTGSIFNFSLVNAANDSEGVAINPTTVEASIQCAQTCVMKFVPKQEMILLNAIQGKAHYRLDLNADGVLHLFEGLAILSR